MRHGSLFSGIGGFDLAAEWMGWDNIFHCEINPFCQKVLKYHFPNAESLTDITKTDFTKYNGTIDIISGGFPCQPYSLAGKRKGKEDDRHLWPEMLRAIREIQPGWVVGENVFGLLNWNRGMVFHEVQTDLEAAGYECFPYVLPACAINAPHRRDRVWIVAHSKSNGDRRRLYGMETTNDSQWQPQEHRQNNVQYWNDGKKWDATNTNSYGCNGSDSEHEINTSEGREYALNDIESADTADTGNERLQGGKINGSIGSIRQNGNELQSAWQDFPTQPPLCSRNDGLSGELVGITVSKHRTESIKAYGNSIVPQIALQIFKAIEQTEKEFFV